MEGLLQSAPNDALVIKMYALRLGLCQLIRDKKIDTEVGINLFEKERDRAIDRRTLEEQQAHKRSAHPL
jgi:thymidine phosphorylase